jgi:hypothetical protein
MASCKYLDWSVASVGTVYGFSSTIGSSRSIPIDSNLTAHCQRMHHCITVVNNNEKSTKSGANIKKIKDFNQQPLCRHESIFSTIMDPHIKAL